MTDDLSRAHWIVPVCGLTCADPDGTVNLHLPCGDSHAMVRFSVSRAAQLCLPILGLANGHIDAANGAAQALTP